MEIFIVAFVVGMVAGLGFLGLLIIGAIKKARDKKGVENETNKR